MGINDRATKSLDKVLTHPIFGEFRLTNKQPDIGKLEGMARNEEVLFISAEIYNGVPERYLAKICLEGGKKYEGYGMGITPEKAAELAFCAAFRQLRYNERIMWQV